MLHVQCMCHVFLPGICMVASCMKENHVLFYWLEDNYKVARTGSLPAT